jgi:uncharacterized protein involved in exopolysaccharide biosynthesis
LNYPSQDTAEPPVEIATEAGQASNGEPAYLQIFLRHSGFLVKGIAVGVVVAALIAFLIPSKYESRAQLMPPDERSSAAGMLMGAAAERAQSLIGLPGDLLGSKTPNALFIKILQSQTLQDDLIRKFDLRRSYSERYWEEARKKLDKNTTITEDRKSGVISIRVRDHDKERARAICQAYIDDLNRMSSALSTSSARREREFLEGRLAVLKQELDVSAANLGQFSSKNTTVDISQQAKAMVESAASLQGDLIASESELNGLKQIYTSDNVRVKVLQSKIDELRRNLRMLTGDASTTSPDGDFAYPSLRKLPLLGVTYSDLLRRAKINEVVYEALIKQYEMAKVQEAKDTPTVRLLDPPSYPERRIFPPRMLITFAGGLTGLIIAGLIVIWNSMSPLDPRRKAIVDTYNIVRNHLPRFQRSMQVEKEMKS